MNRTCLNLLSCLLVLTGCALQPRTDTETLCGYVNPMVGTDYTGHTYPGATLPFGMVSPGPDTHDSGWAYCSGYHYNDTNIMGFSQTHMSGTGCAAMGDILLQPVTSGPVFHPGEKDNPDGGYRSRFSHSTEVAAPGYYAVTLDDYGVRCEMTATPRVAFYRFTFPKDRPMGLVFDMDHGLESPLKQDTLSLTLDGALEGFRRSTGFISDNLYFFHAEFSRPVQSSLQKEHAMYLEFQPGGELLVKVALSTVSSEGAARNMNVELADWEFDDVLEAARDRWETMLSRITMEAGLSQKHIFYTSLYHALIVPNLITDVDGRYRGWDRQVHQASRTQGDLYTNFSLWDTYRAAHPFYALLYPEYNRQFVASMMENWRQTGELPINEYGANETLCMIGDHAVPVIVDAILSGESGLDEKEAFKAVKKALTAPKPKTPWALYDRYGYFPFDLVSEESVSRTMECCYDDWCAYLLASRLNLREDAAFFLRRSGYWRNVYDPSSGLVRGKDSRGAWRTPFDRFYLSHAGDAGGDYTEGNAWQYNWHVQHDVSGMIELNGGSEAFCQKLDSLFTLTEKALNEGSETALDVTGLIGQYAHGNEPSHHVSYLYALAGQPHRTQELLREIMTTKYLDKVDGLCGNDDCGQMSAWYMFTSMGFYPVNPCGGELVLGAPQVPSLTLHLPSGKSFIIRADGLSEKAMYVDRILLDGKEVQGPVIHREDILKGGELRFLMCCD